MIQYLITACCIFAVTYLLFLYNNKAVVSIIDLEDKDEYYFIEFSNGEYLAHHKINPNLNYKIKAWEWSRIKTIKNIMSQVEQDS